MHLPGQQRRQFNGYKLIRRITVGFDASSAVPFNHYATSAAVESFHAGDLDATMRCIQQLLLASPPGNDLLRQNALHELGLLRSRRDSLMMAKVQPRKVKHWDDVLSIVVTSGLLRDASDIRECFARALDVCVSDLPMIGYLKEQLNNRKDLAATTVIRSRLIVQMALCLVAQDDLEALSTRGSFRVFRTIDLTPERGWEWVRESLLSWKF